MVATCKRELPGNRVERINILNALHVYCTYNVKATRINYEHIKHYYLHIRGVKTLNEFFIGIIITHHNLDMMIVRMNVILFIGGVDVVNSLNFKFFRLDIKRV